MFDYERLEALSIEGEAPQSEPERQYYFMKSAGSGQRKRKSESDILLPCQFRR